MLFFKENKRIILQAIFGLLFIGLAVFFIRHEKTELAQVKVVLGTANILWLLAGIVMTCIYIATQGLMYSNSFRTVGEKVPFVMVVKVFLKRNFIGVFLPAGGVSSLGFFTREFERKEIPLTKIHFASSIYAFTGILTVMIVAIPALIWALIRRSLSSNQVFSFVALFVLVLVVVLLFISLVRQGLAYRLIIRIWPDLEKFLAELRSIHIRKKAWIQTILTSLLIEFIGMAHLVIATKTLGFPVSVEVVVIGYITSVLFLSISPFMRGLGAIELSMTYVLTRFGFSTIDAISITLVYRFFEFWLPLLISGLSFVFVRNNLILRIVPAILTFLLGIVNIISVLTPAIHSRLEVLLQFIPLYIVDVSNYFVLMMGLFLLVTAAFLLKGLRTAWYMALGMALFSLIGHLTKAIDYEEALLAGFLIISLFYTRRQYFVRSNPRFEQFGITTALISAVAVVIYGTIGFYFLDKKYFNIDFDVRQSVEYTLQNFFFFRSEHLNPSGSFARDFLFSINIAGFLSLSFLFFTLVRPLIYRRKFDETELVEALELVKKHGKSGLDYFKTYSDKLLFFAAGNDSFLAYRVAGNYAVVLEDPVSSGAEEMKNIIRAFDLFCVDNGLKSFYYRVPEESLAIYDELKKKHLLFGQEAVVDLKDFVLEGRSRKGIRNSCNKARESGYFSKVYLPPLSEDMLDKLKAVSDEWLEYTEYKEINFSQGTFSIGELKDQTIMTIENAEGKVVAFLNLIPDNAPGEGTCDLIRKVKEGPNGLIEFLMAEFFLYMKSRGFQSVNLGFAPMSGIEKSNDLPEMSLRFAYEKIRSFAHYRGLRDFKEKFAPVWYNRYIIYDHHYDLFNLPAVLRKVIKP